MALNRKNKKRVLYLISRENVLEPGVLKSQVLDLVGQIKEDGKNIDILVLNFPSLHKFFKYFRNYKSVKEHALKLGIELVIIPILPIGRSVMPVWAIPFFLIQTAPLAMFYVLKNRINIIHARAYLSAMIVKMLGKIGLSVRLIFDMRGAYLLEGITYGRWRKTDPSYRAWKDIEKSLFSNSDRVVVQSLGLGDYVKRVAPGSKIELIPPCVDDQYFSISNRNRKERRDKLGIADRFVLVYSGSLGSFHEPEFLAETYSKIRNLLPNPYFLVATHSDSAQLANSLKKHGISDKEFSIIRNPKELGKVVPLGDAGLHVMGDLPITPTVIAVKFGEYLSSRLPVIVSKNMLSINNIVDKKGCGVVIDPFDQEDIRVKMQKLVKERDIMSKNALKLAKDYFSIKVCAKKYLDIYDELTSKNKP